jgi:hypothetical protein
VPLAAEGEADQYLVKQFIRNVRASKTIADERAVVQKESAAIRASFREESADHNVRFVAPDKPPWGRELTQIVI